jgi:membrane associated rhomboid family serine protease
MPLILGLLTPIIVGLLVPKILTWLLDFYLIIVIFLPFYALFKFFNDGIYNDEPLLKSFLRHIKIMPWEIPLSSDMRKTGFPLVTFMLIAANTVIFFLVSPETAKKFIFYPVGDVNFLQVAAAFFSSAFLHIDFGHLLSNMLFLWFFGSHTEKRVKSVNFILLYFFFIIMSNTCTPLVLLLQSGTSDFLTTLKNYHSLGASGAVSGVMGLFTVRCYFSKIDVAAPLLIMPVFAVPFRMYGLMFTAVYFSLDVLCGTKQFQGVLDDNTAYWAHVGGYVGGILIAYRLGLQKEAAKEAVEHKAEVLSKAYLEKENAVKAHDAVLLQDGQNISSLKYLLGAHKYNDDKAAGYYSRLMSVYIETKNFRSAAELFASHYPQYIKALPPDILVRLGNYFLKGCSFQEARACLEFAIKHEGQWQAKALILLADTYENIGNHNRAVQLLSEVTYRFPHDQFGLEAWRRLDSY